MEPHDEALHKHFHVALQAMAASLNNFPLEQHIYKQGPISLTLETPGGQKIAANVHFCLDPGNPTGPCMIQFEPCITPCPEPD